MTAKEKCIDYLQKCGLEYDDFGEWVRVGVLGIEYYFGGELDGAVVAVAEPWNLQPPRKAHTVSQEQPDKDTRGTSGFEFL